VYSTSDSTTYLQCSIERLVIPLPSEAPTAEEHSKLCKLIFYFFRDVLGLIAARHPAVLPIIGWNVSFLEDTPHMFYVAPVMPTGMLEVSESFLTPSLFGTEKTVFLYGVARAMASCHARGILHRNLKPGHILLNTSLHPHLAGFESCTIAAAASKEQCGTMRYMAPEVMLMQPSAPPIDVYSFGILMFEVTEDRRHEFPDGVRQPRDIRVQVAQKGFRPTPTKATPLQKVLMAKCWHARPEGRPTFAEIVATLEQELYWSEGTEEAKFLEYKASLDAAEAAIPAVKPQIIERIARLPLLYEMLKKKAPGTPFKELLLDALAWLTAVGPNPDPLQRQLFQGDLDEGFQLSPPLGAGE
jgi:serine/threonine protein kinase